VPAMLAISTSPPTSSARYSSGKVNVVPVRHGAHTRLCQ
jgi:hypothetical protein